MTNDPCIESCRATVYCTTCEKRKAPVGRSVGLGADDLYCNLDCTGYRADPKPPHLWPNECLACSTLFRNGERRDCDECIAREAAND